MDHQSTGNIIWCFGFDVGCQKKRHQRRVKDRHVARKSEMLRNCAMIQTAVSPQQRRGIPVAKIKHSLQ